jgi:hypothetical protein
MLLSPADPTKAKGGSHRGPPTHMLLAPLAATLAAAALATVLAKRPAPRSSLGAVCDPEGLAQSPPACFRRINSGPARHLPRVFGGPSTLGQCDFGQPGRQGGVFAGSCWTGSLFGFSGVDGACPQDHSCTGAQFVGWFVNGSYSVFLNTPEHRQLRLGFGPDAAADPDLDTVLVATNDALLVQRGDSRIGVTWSGWRTIVGFVEGPDASVALHIINPAAPHGGGGGGSCRFQGGCCNAVKQSTMAAVSSRYWRWSIESTFSGAAGPTICYIGLQIGSQWLTSPSWKLTAQAHPNGPVDSLLTRDCSTFWNSDIGKGAPWNLTIDLGQAAAASVTGFEYSIYKPDEAPKSFIVQVGDSAAASDGGDDGMGSWRAVVRESSASNDGCNHTEPKPTVPPVLAVNESLSKDDALALVTKKTKDAHTNFALSYACVSCPSKPDPGPLQAMAVAKARATAAVAGLDVVATMAARNQFILDVRPS